MRRRRIRGGGKEEGITTPENRKCIHPGREKDQRRMRGGERAKRGQVSWEKSTKLFTFYARNQKTATLVFVVKLSVPEVMAEACGFTGLK